jgi:flagellar basal-body rod protein FlgB
MRSARGIGVKGCEILFNKVFRHVNLMQRGMDAAWMRQEVHSHNIANVDTPGYKQQTVAFESMLRAAMSSGDKLKGTRTHEKHIHIGAPTDPTAVMPYTVGHTHFNIRMDENNVDIDHEMHGLAANYIRYSTLQAQVMSEFSKMRMVIREGS